jgi:hypothetical protein
VVKNPSLDPAPLSRRRYTIFPSAGLGTLALKDQKFVSAGTAPLDGSNDLW